MKKLEIYFGSEQVGVRIGGFGPEALEKAMMYIEDCGCSVKQILDEEELDFISGEYFIAGPVYDGIKVLDENKNTIYEGNPDFLEENEIEGDEEDDYVIVEYAEGVFEECQKFNRMTGGESLVWESYEEPSIPFVLELQDDEEFDIKLLKIRLSDTTYENSTIIGCFYNGQELEWLDGWGNRGIGSYEYKIGDEIEGL